MSTRRRRIPALVLSLAVLLAISGCSAAGGGADSASVADPVSAGEAAPMEESSVDPAVVITGSISIRVDDPIAAADDATAMIEKAEGRVSGRQEYAGSGSGSASADLTLRVPADRVDDVRASLKELGEVLETALESTDVSATQRDLDARITTLRTSISRYSEWLGTASKTTDLIELETEIATRQSELESLEAEQRALQDQVSMSTIALHLMQERVAAQTEPADFGAALVVGWSGFLGFWTGFGLLITVSLPWLLLLGVAAAVIVWLVRRGSRQRASS